MGIIVKIGKKAIMKFLLGNNGDLRLWARVFPWIIMTCIVILTLAFAYSLIK